MDELRKELMMAETSIRTNVSDICNLLLNGRIIDEQALEDVVDALSVCQETVIRCRMTLEA